MARGTERAAVEAEGMRFDRESWRKLYVVESVQHRLLPLFTRGLRDYLLRHAESDGTILRGSADHAADLARVLCATQQERKQIDAALADLLRVGYLSTDGERLWIVKFEEAQSARSPGAKRQAAYLARKKGDAPDDVSSDVSSDVTSDASDDGESDVTNDVTRDETRRDETRDIRSVFEFWQQTHDHRGAKLDSARTQRIRARLREGFTPDQLKKAIANAKLDEFLMGKNDRNRVFDGLETLLKNAAQVERLEALSNGKSAVIEIQ